MLTLQTVSLSSSLRLGFEPALFCISLLALGFLPQGILPCLLLPLGHSLDGLGRSFFTSPSLGLSLRGSLCLSLRLGLSICSLFCGDLCFTLALLCSANYMLTRDDTFLDDVTIAHSSVVQLVRGTRQG